jgi:dipeptidyl aminopeptidase/acylaminoacyl peptidase
VSLKALALCLAAVPAAAAQATHPFSVHDMLAMDRISDPQVSPDGTQVAFQVRVTDLERNRGVTSLWIVPVDGSQAPRAVTEGSDGAWGARWTADGKGLVYLAPQEGVVQVWRLDLESGASACLSAFPVDVSGIVVMPDGERLVLAMDVYPDLDPAGALAATAARDKQRAEDPVQARVYDELLFRHWDTWEDGKRSHVFVWRIGGGDPLDLMPGWEADGPTHPFGGMEEVAVSPEGDLVVFAAKKVGREAAWSTDVDLWAAPPDGSREVLCLTEANQAYDNQPAFSPDGRFLAWLAMDHPGYESDRQVVIVYERDTNRIRRVSDRLDRSPSSITWAPDSRTIYASAPDMGNTSIYLLDALGGKIQRLVHKGTNGSPAVAGRRVVYLHDDLRSPAELRTMALDGTDDRPLTQLNGEKVAAARMGEYEQFGFLGWQDDDVYGYVLKPADFREGVKYPVAFLIHGGPQGSFSDHFHYRWNPQAYAGAGYAAVFIDFHGSTGYGQAFTDSIREDWGGKPFVDLMKGLDVALAKYDFLDGSRVGALGASFGGYMINWIEGQTDRFKCLVNHDGNLDERMAYYDTEELWFPERDHGGTPWENPTGYMKHNPIEHVGSWTTPMLVIHGGKDYRVVDAQGMSTFTALQRRGIPSRFLYFPDENHWVLKPRNSILWHETVLDWLARWLGPEGATKPVPASSSGGPR